MRRVGVLACLAVQMLWAPSAIAPRGAAAQPADGPRETVEQTYSAARAHAPTGATYTGSYHAAGDPRGNPPVMRRMTFYPPRGMRYDTSVPERCGATDIELEAQGPAACPAGSRLGGGTAEGLFLVPFAHDNLVDHYKHNVHIFNNAGEQIVLIESEGFTVVRGRFRPDGSLEFTPPSCFPSPPAGGCSDDYIVQLKSYTLVPPYTKRSGGQVRSYITTPPRCPARRFWRTKVRFWWADGSADSVVTKQPCRSPHRRRRAS